MIIIFMKKFIDLAGKSLLSGIAIGIGATVYVSVGGVVGAILFAFGLITIISYRWSLYTGLAGFVANRADAVNLLPIIVFNSLGCYIAAVAVAYGRPELIDACRVVVDARLSHSLGECFVLAIGCGFIMTVIVKFAREEGKWLPLLFGIPVFILCGFLHSIADAFYISLANEIANPSMIYRWLIVIAGNFVGCNLIRIIQRTN